MADEQTQTATPAEATPVAPAKVKRAQASKRACIDSKGATEGVAEHDAVGVLYTMLPSNKTIAVFWQKAPADYKADAVIDELNSKGLVSLAAFGCQTWIGNRTSQVRNAKDGGPTDDSGMPLSEFEHAVAGLESVKLGVWPAPAGGGGGNTALVVAALARIAGLELEEAQTKWAGKTDDEKKDLQGNSKVKEMIATIKLERAKEASNDDDELAIANF